MKIRKATISDLEELISLGLEVHNFHLKERPDEFKELTKKELCFFYHSVLNDDDQDILVCLEHDEMVGYILIKTVIRRDNPFQKARRFLYVDQIDVKQEFRRRGIGSLLLKEAQREAKKKKLDQVVLHTWNFNKEAFDFFLSYGFTPEIQKMVFPVG